MSHPRAAAGRYMTYSSVFAALALTALPCFAQLEEVRAAIPGMLAEDGAASIAVAVARDGEIIWAEGFGWADRELRRPATEHTLYSLASISKPITATGLMVLVERGLIDLDRPIDDYLGAAKITARGSDASAATVRRVANHTAGLPLYFQFFYRDEDYPRPPMDETIRRYASLVSPPGETWRYSNLGYGMLDYIVERVSGTSFADFMRQEVFLPLDLTHMTVDIGPGLEHLAATRYTPAGVPLPFYGFDHPGASAVFSSVHDLARFGMFHLGQIQPDQHAVLSPASRAEMLRPTAEIGGGLHYGVGWGTAHLPERLRVISPTRRARCRTASSPRSSTPSIRAVIRAPTLAAPQPRTRQMTRPRHSAPSWLPCQNSWEPGPAPSRPTRGHTK